MNYQINLFQVGIKKNIKFLLRPPKQSPFSFRFSLYFFTNVQTMYGLYDKEGILRYVNSDKDACIAYAELFDLSEQNYLLMSLKDTIDDLGDINFDQNPAKNSN